MSDPIMPRIVPHFAITEDNELLFEWWTGNRHLTLYVHPPDEEGMFECFGSTGPFCDQPDFESIHEGYRWLVGLAPLPSDVPPTTGAESGEGRQ